MRSPIKHLITYCSHAQPSGAYSVHAMQSIKQYTQPRNTVKQSVTRCNQSVTQSPGHTFTQQFTHSVAQTRCNREICDANHCNNLHCESACLLFPLAAHCDLHGCIGQGERVHCSKSAEQKAPRYANNASTNAVWRSVAVAVHRQCGAFL